MHTDGKITYIHVDEEYANQTSNGEDVFKCIVSRENDYQQNEVYRTFEEFCKLYRYLLDTFTQLKLSNTPVIEKFKNLRSNQRRFYVTVLINDLLKLTPEIRDVK